MVDTCPFCGCNPFHYVDNGIGMEAVAVTCCDLGDMYFRGARPEIDGDVTMDADTFRDVGRRIKDLEWQVERRDRLIGMLFKRRNGTAHV